MPGIMDALFGKKPAAPPPKTPQEMGREWKHQLSHESRNIDKQIRKINMAQQKAKIEAKKAAKANEMGAVRIFAKEILHSQKTVKRLQVTKTQISSVQMQIQLQVSQIKVTGSLQKSTEVMATMSNLVKVGDIAATMQNLSREMTRAGLMEEMVEDTLDGVMDDVSDTEADEEVDKIVADLLTNQMSGTRVNNSKLPAQQAAEAEEPVVEEADDDELMAKFNAMKAS